MKMLKVFLLLSFWFAFQQASAQCTDPNTCAVYSPYLSPGIDWKDEFWVPDDMSGNLISQGQSDEDWHYDLIEYTGGTSGGGYIGIGFAGIIGFTDLTFSDENNEEITCYTRNMGEPKCKVLRTELNPPYLHRQTIVYYDYNGEVTSYQKFNLGDLYGGVQDGDGNIYLIGVATNPRSITESNEISSSAEPLIDGVPIYYNPTIQNQSEFPLSSTVACSQFQYKFNVLKINASGQLLWNNYYGLEDDLEDAMDLGGRGISLILDGNSVLAVGSAQNATGSDRKFIVRIDKLTGNLFWKQNIDPSEEGRIFQINKDGNNYLISGEEDTEVSPGNSMTTAFVSKYSGLASAFTFSTPDFSLNGLNIPSTLGGVAVDQTKHQKCSSAIFNGGKIYWFVSYNGDSNYTSGNFIGRGATIELDMNGSYLSLDDLGDLRAYDMWISGVPTDDGGFALVTTKQSPKYYGTPNLPARTDDIDSNNPSLGTIGDCLDQIDSTCIEFNIPNSKLFNLMSTCSYIRKYGPNFTFEWDKIWDSTNNAPRECYPGNLKQQECVYRIIQSSVDGGLLICGNTSSNVDDSYMVKLYPDCAVEDFAGGQTGPDIIADYDDGVYEITGTEVWSTPKKVMGRVNILDDASLTILNTTVSFATNTDLESGISVEPNGHLIVDNSTLTSLDGCGAFWAGIQVWGDANEHQYTYGASQYHQGRATIKNESIIENATNGVQNWKPDDWGMTGGIIQVEESDFVNCRRAAAFLSYQNKDYGNNSNQPERSYFYDCDFNINNDYLHDMDAAPPKPRITMWEIDRLRIEGCHFLNTASVSTSEARGKAILGHDSNFIVREHCDDPNPVPGSCNNEIDNHFEGWHKAIEAGQSITSRPMMVRNSTFTKNMIGIEMAGANFSEVYWNEFELGGHDIDLANNPDHPNLEQLGVFSNFTEQFSLEENKFELEASAPNKGHGVLVYNSDGNDNRVYHNDFENLEVGANGWQINRNPSQIGKIPEGAIGLQFLCNENTGNTVDFEISREGNQSDPTYLPSGIRREQGTYSPLETAENVFSSPNSDPSIYSHFTIDSDQSHNYMGNNVNSPLSAEIGPDPMGLSLTFGAYNTCPLRYGSSGGGTGISGKMAQTTSELQSMTYAYSQIIDEGNTIGILNDIALTWPEDAWDLRDQLMARSPYNSEEVLIAAAKKEIMPHAMLLEVLVANPEALTNGDVIKAVELELNDPLPSYMIDMLHIAKDEKTLRSSMESTIGKLHAEASLIQKQGVNQVTFDLSEEVKPDSTLYYLSQLYTNGNNYTHAFVQADRGYYTEALALLDSTLTHYRLEPFELAECNRLIDFLSLMESVEANGRTSANMDETEITAMIEIAEDEEAGLAALKAQNTLCFHYDICYMPSGQPNIQNIARIRTLAYDADAILDKMNKTNVYPSPADYFVTVDFTLAKAKAATELRLYDNLGRSVHSEKLGATYEGQTVIDTRELPNGVYILQITQDGEQVETNKFIVTH